MTRDGKVDGLEALAGEWTIHAAPPGGDPWPGEGRLSFEWLEGRTWLVQRWTVHIPEAPDGIAILGVDADGGLRQHYFDSRGVHRVYEMALERGVWRLWREAADPFPQRYSGAFSDDGREIAGRWEKQEHGRWAVDFDIVYRRVS
jgi:hypothetical protein